MTRTQIVAWRLAAVASGMVALAGCAWLGGDSRHHDGSTPLVEFLYADREVPPVSPEVHLELPIRVAVMFLPEKNGSVHSGPTAQDREKVVNAIQDRFRALPYVTEIQSIPGHYLRAGENSDGLGQIQQLSRLHRFDLIALVSYDQVLDRSLNKNSFIYLTLVGEYLVRGNRNETHTLLDLAVIDPRSRALVLRSGGVSSLAGNVTAVESRSHANAQRSKGFELATSHLLDNFSRELTAFEARVREGRAPVRVTKRVSGGGGSADAMLLIALLVTGFLASPGRRSSASARW